VERQRQLKACGRLSAERVRKMEQLGFVWDMRADRWRSMIEALKAYIRKFGHARVPSAFSADSRLSEWVRRVRQMKRKGKLSAERVAELNQLAFVWSPHHSTWENCYAEVSTFMKDNSGCTPTAKTHPKLWKWLVHQRALLRKGKLARDRADRLRRLGIKG